MGNLSLNDTEPVYTLSIVSKLSDTPRHSIRQYVDQGLILPYVKKSNRHLFSDVDVQRLLWTRNIIEEKGFSFAGIKTLLSLIPCWEIKNCKKKDRKNCEAYYLSNSPCWEASKKSKECKNKDCRVCEVYKLINPDVEMKSVFKQFLP